MRIQISVAEASTMKLVNPLVYWQAAVLLTASVAGLSGSGGDEQWRLFSLPLFRAPNRTEIDSSRCPIIWSAHQTGDSRRLLPSNTSARLACLLDDVSPSGAGLLRSLVWTLAGHKSGGQAIRRSLSGHAADFEVEAAGGKLKGRYNERWGSVLQVSFPSPMREHLRIRCEYQPAALNSTIASDWLLLWDERTEIGRLQSAALQCNRTVYKRIGHVSGHLPLAVSYDCIGLGDTRMLEAAVVAVYAAAGGAAACSAETAQQGAAIRELSSNSTEIRRGFFGVAFSGRVHLGWTVAEHPGTNESSLAGAELEQRLKAVGVHLCLLLDTILPSGSACQLHFPVPRPASTEVSFVSVDQPLFLWSSTLAVHMDELLDPLNERTLPCPILCLSADATMCRHQWVGPATATQRRRSPASQPLALQLCGSDEGIAGSWACSAKLSKAPPVSYAVTTRPRMRVGEPRPPRRTVMFPSDSITINCTLCGVTDGNSSAEFEVLDSTAGAESYRFQKLNQVLPNGMVSLSLNISDLSQTNDGGIILLRCRGAGNRGDQRAVTDFATVNLLPLPAVKSLPVCQPYAQFCSADCRSPMESFLRHIGVSVAYYFSFYNQLGQLLNTLLSDSGWLNDVRNASGHTGFELGILVPTCRQLFYYTEARDRLSIGQVLGQGLNQFGEYYRAELGESRYKRLIFASDQSDEAAVKAPTNPPEVKPEVKPRDFSPLLIFLITLLLAAGASVAFIAYIELKKDVRNAGPDILDSVEAEAGAPEKTKGKTTKKADESNNSAAKSAPAASGEPNEDEAQSDVPQPPRDIVVQNAVQENNFNSFSQELEAGQSDNRYAMPVAGFSDEAQYDIAFISSDVSDSDAMENQLPAASSQADDVSDADRRSPNFSEVELSPLSSAKPANVSAIIDESNNAINNDGPAKPEVQSATPQETGVGFEFCLNSDNSEDDLNLT